MKAANQNGGEGHERCQGRPHWFRCRLNCILHSSMSLLIVVLLNEVLPYSFLTLSPKLNTCAKYCTIIDVRPL
jgi:hypothetical protein